MSVKIEFSKLAWILLSGYSFPTVTGPISLPFVDISAIKRIRVIFHHNGATGADAEVFVRMVTADSFG